MSEVHRYQVVKMLSEAGNRISYDPHGPEVVMAEAYDRLKAENEALRDALIGVINHVEGNTECLVRDLVNWGTPKVDANEFYDECGQIKAIAQAALDSAMAKERAQ